MAANIHCSRLTPVPPYADLSGGPHSTMDRRGAAVGWAGPVRYNAGGVSPLEAAVLRGVKSVLRPIEEDDLPLLWKWENDSELTYYLNADRHRTMSMEEISRRYRQIRNDPTMELFIIETIDGERIGMLGYDTLSVERRSCRVYIGIGEKEYWSRGYGSDAMRALLAHHFVDLHLERVYLSVYDFNDRAIASYRKCGYRVDGVRRNVALVDGQWCDSIEMSVTAVDFERHHTRLPSAARDRREA
jgi:[ribosomal protein S5]-alanine N-acetyltransferase